jgi:hypothetical protein
MKCTGHTSAGRDCRNDAIKGATVCHKHGGSAPHVRRNAAVRAELLSWGLNDSTEDPGEVLLRLVTQSAHRAAFYADLLEQQYESTEETTLLPAGVAALIGHKIGAAGKDGVLYEAEEAIRGLVQLEAMERDRCARFAKTAIDAGIAERQVTLAERQGALIADVLRAVLADPELGLSAEQRKAVPNVARRHLAIAN